jgi:hypothetical protein
MICMNWTAAPAEIEEERFRFGGDRWILCLFLLLALFFSMPPLVSAAGEPFEPSGKDQNQYQQIFEPSPGSFRPELSPEEALKIAARYVQEKRVDLSRQYIHFIRLDYDPGTKKLGFYWRVHWRWAAPRMGGEYGLRIYMDKTVLPEIAGP